MVMDDDGTIRNERVPGKVENGADVLKQLGSPTDEGWDFNPCDGWEPEMKKYNPLKKALADALWGGLLAFFADQIEE